MCPSNKDFSTRSNALYIEQNVDLQVSVIAISPWLGMGLSGTLSKKQTNQPQQHNIIK